jgi:LacI family transcriptional regulator
MKKPTVRDIARHAGVSVATVSRVTKEDPRVAASTRDRVLASITELGYSPSALGRALAFQRFDALGLVLPGLSGPYFAELMAGAESVTLREGSAVLVLGTHLRADSPKAVRQLATRTDALVVVGGTVEEDVLAELTARMPLVVVAGAPDGLPTVRTDGTAAVRRLVDHLVGEHQLRELLFVGFDPASPDTVARYTGFADALAARGLTEADAPVRVGLETVQGAMVARRLHAAGRVPRALVCANDEIAIGMLATLPGLGYRIPDDVVVVGFDDHALAANVSPTLTTVHQPIFDLGVKAAELAMSAVGGDPLPADVWTLPTDVVLRESCGCPPPQEPASTP